MKKLILMMAVMAATLAVVPACLAQGTDSVEGKTQSAGPSRNRVAEACAKLHERLDRQNRIGAVHECSMRNQNLRTRSITTALRRCRRADRRRLRDFIDLRAATLEHCLVDRIKAQIDQKHEPARNAAGVSHPPTTRSQERGAAGQRLEDLLASGPRVPNSLADGARPQFRERTFRSGLVWSYAGKIPGMHCVLWNEPSDPHNWYDNYLCTENDVGFQWSYRGPILGRGLKCIQIREKSDPHDWHDNYFCWPGDLNVTFRFSATGRVPGYSCIAIVEPSDPHTWQDNYLCHRAQAG